MCVRKIAKFTRINKAGFVSSRKILDKGNCFKKPYFITRKNHFHSTNTHTRMLVLNNNFSVISLKLRYNFYWASPIKALGFNYFMIFKMHEEIQIHVYRNLIRLYFAHPTLWVSAGYGTDYRLGIVLTIS